MHRLPKILVVEDNIDILTLLRHQLEHRQYTVATALTGQDALDQFVTFWPDIVLCDILMSGMDGFQVARQIKARSNVPIIFLTVIDEPGRKALALQDLAHDYIVKPCDPRELYARIERVLRCNGINVYEHPIVLDKDLTIDLGTSAAITSEQTIKLTVLEARILYHLIQNGGKPMSDDDLLRHLWPTPASKEMLRRTIHNLRAKIEPDPHNPRYILTRPRGSYLLAIESAPIPRLTDQQMHVLRLVARGATDNDIAALLKLSSRTVRDHILEIRKILNANSRPHLIALAMTHGLLTSTDIHVSLPE